jgi:16S rRNA (adenine1518-N6/adenine1519-N6)-dimethyltransferase
MLICFIYGLNSTTETASALWFILTSVFSLITDRLCLLYHTEAHLLSREGDFGYTKPMAKKHLGQNFLYDPSILRRIIDAARIGPEDTVVEIGPGPGRMTAMLADRVRRVIAIELDETLYERLSIDLSGRENIELVHGDALKYRFDTLEEFKVVANIPYYITTPILFTLLEHRSRLRSITITLQKEVAARIVAGPGGKEYGVLSLMVQYYGKPDLKFIVPKGAFSSG